MIIKVAIVEDNLEDQALMSGILEQWSRIRTEGVCKIRKDYYETGENFLAEVRKFQLKYHLIFMDIGLGGKLSGLETAQSLRETGDKTPLVFLTMDDKHIRDGYQVRALDYLIKPAGALDVYKCLERLSTVYSEASYIIEDRMGTIEIPYKDIICFNQTKNYMEIMTETAAWRQRISIKELEHRLPIQFVRCNRGCIINIMHVKQIQKKAVLMSNRRDLSISAPYIDSVQKMFKDRQLFTHLF